MRVCVAGTFNILHKGHKKLLEKAYQTAGKNGSVFIGVTKGEILDSKPFVKSFTKRVCAIRDHVAQNYTTTTVITSIYDKYGPTLDEDFDAIIVTPDTIATAKEINKIRVKKYRKPLEIIQIPLVVAEDNKPISSTRIHNREIDEEGHILNHP